LIATGDVHATPAKLRKAYDAAVRIESPNFHSPNTIDCGHCHVTPIARILNGEQNYHLTPSAQVPLFQPGPSVAAAEMAAVTNQYLNPDGQLNMHVFSYTKDRAHIGPRVINETAAILAWVRAQAGNPPNQ